MLLGLVCAVLVAFAHGAWAGERLACAVVYKGSDYSAVKTEIFAIDPDTARKQLVFSDERTPIVLLQRLYVFHFPVAIGRKLFAHAAERGENLPFPGNGSLYGLSTDGSNSFRRIGQVLGDGSLGDIFVNSRGTRVGYLNGMKGRQCLFIHDVATGELLYQVDVADIFLDCFASSIGWLPAGEKLFFSLETGDEDMTSEASYGRVGTYFMDERGGNQTKLPRMQAREGFSSPEIERMIGVLPTGEYLFETTQVAKRAPHEYGTALLKAKRDFSTVDDVTFDPAAKLYTGIRLSYTLSPSGKYLAAASLPVSASASAWDIWLKDLQDGKERRLLSIPTEGLKGPFLGLVGWLDR